MPGVRGKEETTDEGQVAVEWKTGEVLLRMCHDLRAHLRSIQPYAESLLKSDEGAAAEERKKLQFIANGARRLDLLVEALASYAIALQIEPVRFRPIPMDILLRGSLMKLDRELRANRAQVSSDKLPTVQGDPDRLVQIFDILIRNCLLRRGIADPDIRIVVESQPEGWLFAVRDNGPEIDSADLERIFRPMERLDSEAARTDPGLGLATCRIIMARHGGRIWAESRWRGEFAFLFTLPRVEERLHEDQS